MWTSIALVLMIAAMTACTGDPDEVPPYQEDFPECQPTAYLVGVTESAAGFPYSCAQFIDVIGVEYALGGCHPVDAAFLGPMTARNETLVAREIEGTEEPIALAIKDLDSQAGRRCGGWQVSGRLGNSEKDAKAVKRLVCRVRPEEIPAVPRWCTVH